MRVACVYIDRFAAAVEAREQPELLSRPIVIGGFPNERKPVLECSAEAAGSGIAPGMPLRQAHHICPDAVFIPLSTGRYDRAFENVLDILDEFSPTVDVDGLGRAFLDIGGMERLLGSEAEIAERIGSEVLNRTQLEPKIGIGGNKLVAGVAASMASCQHPSVIKMGKESKFLAPLPASLLPLSGETKRRFELLGLRTVGQIASLPLDAVANQFGEEGVLAHKLASGEDERPLLPRARPAVLESELCSESSLETVEALLAALDRVLDRLMPVLKSRNQVCGKIRLCFYLDRAESWQENLTLKEPTDSKREMLSLLKHRLETVQFPDGITGIHLELAQLGGEQGKQDSLFSGERARQRERLKRVVKHLQARFGNNPLKMVVQVDPESRIPERRSVLVDFTP